MTTPRKFGWAVPGKEQLARLKFTGLPTSKLTTSEEPLPDSVDLEHLTKVFDQLDIGSCVAQAVAQVIRADMAKQTLDLDVEAPSRRWLYQYALAMQGTRGQDVGTSVAIAMDAAAEHGYPPEHLCPYYTTDLDNVPRPSASRAAFDQIQRSRLSYHAVDDFGAFRVQAVNRALADGNLVAFGTRVDEAFAANQLPAGFIVGPPSLADTVGGHAMAICGYAKQSDGTYLYRVVNSWGPDWGDGGYFWMTESYLVWPFTADMWFVKDVPLYTTGYGEGGQA